MKWIKSGGICGVILSVIFLWLVLDSYILVDLVYPIAVSYILYFLTFLLWIFFYYGFIKVGSYTKSKILMISSWVMVIIPLVIFILFLLIISQPADPRDIVALVALPILYFILYSLTQISFSIALIKMSSQIRLARVSGIFGLLTSVYFGGGYIIFRMSSYQGLQIPPLFFIIYFSLIFILFLLEAIVLFNASKEFEIN